MKALKYFGMLFVYPVLLLGTGFLGGAAFVSYFYPGGFQMQIKQESIPNTENQTIESSENSNMPEENDISGWQRVCPAKLRRIPGRIPLMKKSPEVQPRSCFRRRY